MAVPGPVRPEAKTQIVFVGSTKDELLTIVVDQKGRHSRNVPVERAFRAHEDGVPIWVNVERALHGQGD
jgi:hypothetical protein